MYQIAGLQIFVFLHLNGMCHFYPFRRCHYVLMEIWIERCHGSGMFDSLEKSAMCMSNHYPNVADVLFPRG
jgi:hypothetical protein